MEAYGELVDGYSGELEFGDGKLRVEGLSASVSGGRISSSFGVDLESREHSGSMQLGRLQLEGLHLLQQQTPVRGELSLSLEGQGRFDYPDFRVDASSSLVQVGDFTLEDVHLEADAEGDVASIKLAHRLAENPFLFEGTAGLSVPYPLDVSLYLEKIPLGPYMALLGHDPGSSRGWFPARPAVPDRFCRLLESTLRAVFPRLNCPCRGIGSETAALSDWSTRKRR